MQDYSKLEAYLGMEPAQTANLFPPDLLGEIMAEIQLEPIDQQVSLLLSYVGMKEIFDALGFKIASVIKLGQITQLNARQILGINSTPILCDPDCQKQLVLHIKKLSDKEKLRAQRVIFSLAMMRAKIQNNLLGGTPEGRVEIKNGLQHEVHYRVCLALKLPTN